MSTVYVGSARADEYGASGWRGNSRPGDQTGREVSIQAWYKHPIGWVVMRPKSSEVAHKIAYAMRAACDNERIGYNQAKRLTLWDAAKEVGYDPAKVTEKVETDCSALVRVCVAYAGIIVGNFRTTTEADTLEATGEFKRLTADKFTTRPDYLREGDILVTKTTGHTVVVLNDGDKAEDDCKTLLVVDGYLGPKTVKATQRYFHTTVDGVISSQPEANRKYWYCDDGGIEWVARGYGSNVVFAWARWLNKMGQLVPLSRIANKGFVKALQRYLKAEGLYIGEIDGSAGRETCKAWQTFLNLNLH